MTGPKSTQGLGGGASFRIPFQAATKAMGRRSTRAQSPTESPPLRTRARKRSSSNTATEPEAKIRRKRYVPVPFAPSPSPSVAHARAGAVRRRPLRHGQMKSGGPVHLQNAAGHPASEPQSLRAAPRHSHVQLSRRFCSALQAQATCGPRTWRPGAAALSALGRSHSHQPSGGPQQS